VDEYRQSDNVAKFWFLSAFLWFPIFTTIGFILAIKFFAPTFLSSADWLTFGRLRPFHVNGVLFGFISSSLLGGMFYMVPRLCKKPLQYPALAKLAAILWNLAVLVGAVLILLGYSQGREYAELPWIIDVAVMATLLLMGFIVFSTITKRIEKKLYATLWYFAGTMLWFPVVYFIGNVMWNPPVGAMNGVIDGIFNWYYGHNVLGLWFTTLGIPIWYYAIPKITKRPLYSHLLSLIAFFSIAFFYTGVGAHHLLQAPIPEFVKTIAVIMSMLMVVPVITFAVNILLTMRGTWGVLVKDIPFRFIFAGFAMYALASFQGSFQSFRTTNAYLHFSQWPVGHAHLALLGGFGFLSAGLLYWLVPKVIGKSIYSRKLTSLSFWLAFLGFIVFFSAMSIAGLVANSAWWEHVNLVAVLPLLRPHFIYRAIGGGMIVVAAYILAYNILMTFVAATKPHEENEAEVAEQTREKAKTVRKPPEIFKRSQERLNLPILMSGGMVLFVIMTFMVVGMPYMFTNNQPTSKAHVLSSAEKEGLGVYKANGCFYCHSQFVRPQDWAWGEVSQSGDFVYSVPHFLGTERTGPNLAQIGGMRPTEWHYFHYANPRTVSPTSIMPDFAFIPKDELDALVSYVNNLGGKNQEPNAFQPVVPEPYTNAANPFMPLMTSAAKGYDAEKGEYTGDEATGAKFAATFEEGKVAFAEKCLSCHGCSGNGQGPYGRYVVTRPANLHERISNYPTPDTPFHFWRVSEGVPGTAMPAWKISLGEELRFKILIYELSFADGAIRTVSGDVSDAEGDAFDAQTHIVPPIAGTKTDYEQGKQTFELYCAQCHGLDGLADGPASSLTPGGYIKPEPANFEESGSDFTNYGRYVWKVQEGVETTNMLPWKYVLSDEEIFRVILYIQTFSKPEDYNSKWAGLYRDSFAQGLKR
jgi:cytochrome c oxidase cbb3-type subunit I/II